LHGDPPYNYIVIIMVIFILSRRIQKVKIVQGVERARVKKGQIVQKVQRVEVV